MQSRSRLSRRISVILLAVAIPLTQACDDDSEPAGPNAAPVVQITTPAADTEVSDMGYTYDGYDDTLMMWYKDVLLEGSAIDAEDGTLGGSDVVWTTDRTDLQDAGLGEGSSLTVRLYSDQCTGTWHEIAMAATDSDGESGTAARQIFIWTLC
jgi:hypothetical protein